MIRTMPVIEGAADALWRLSDAGIWLRIITHRLYVNWAHERAVGRHRGVARRASHPVPRPLLPRRQAGGPGRRLHRRRAAQRHRPARARQHRHRVRSAVQPPPRRRTAGGELGGSGVDRRRPGGRPPRPGRRAAARASMPAATASSSAARPSKAGGAARSTLRTGCNSTASRDGHRYDLRHHVVIDPPSPWTTVCSLPASGGSFGVAAARRRPRRRRRMRRPRRAAALERPPCRPDPGPRGDRRDVVDDRLQSGSATATAPPSSAPGSYVRADRDMHPAAVGDQPADAVEHVDVRRARRARRPRPRRPPRSSRRRRRSSIRRCRASSTRRRQRRARRRRRRRRPRPRRPRRRPSTTTTLAP